MHSALDLIFARHILSQSRVLPWKKIRCLLMFLVFCFVCYGFSFSLFFNVLVFYLLFLFSSSLFFFHTFFFFSFFSFLLVPSLSLFLLFVITLLLLSSISVSMGLLSVVFRPCPWSSYFCVGCHHVGVLLRFVLSWSFLVFVAVTYFSCVCLCRLSLHVFFVNACCWRVPIRDCVLLVLLRQKCRAATKRDP